MAEKDTKEEWLKQKFKDAGVKLLSDKERKELQEKMQGYLRFRNSLETQIEEHAKEIKNLKERIDTAIPSVPGAKYIHVCGYKAAIRIGRTPEGGMGGGDDVYYCLYCDREYM